MRRKSIIWFLPFVFVVMLTIFSWDGLGRMMYPVRYPEMIGQHAAVHQVDPYLVAAMIRVESNFDPEAVSKKGAVGLMQVMPQTASWILSRKDRPMLEEASDSEVDAAEKRLTGPQLNLTLGTWYVNYLNEQFAGNLPVVVAAYNAGPGTVRRWLESGIWDGSAEQSAHIPFPETRQYVRKVIFFRERYLDYHEELWPDWAAKANGPSATVTARR